jgi:prephenate dehydratase/chorismate mutase/prephenate dehydratase
LRSVIGGLIEAGDSVKTLGVLPSRGEIDATVDEERIPPLSADASSSPGDLERALLW